MSGIKPGLMPGLFSFLAWAMIHTLGLTSRKRVIGYENVQKLAGCGRGFILAVWHGRTLLPVHYCRGTRMWAITSLSSDGELQTRIISRFGYQIIRGSSRRGGIRAALTACKRLQEGGILAITPDGPMGPSHEVQEGVVFLAQRAQCPIIPIGVGLESRMLMKAWDSYALPMPFSRSVLIFGDPIMPSDLDCGEGASTPADVIRAALNDVECRAQKMAKETC